MIRFLSLLCREKDQLLTIEQELLLHHESDLLETKILWQSGLKIYWCHIEQMNDLIPDKI